MYDFFFTIPISNNQDSAPGVWGREDAETLATLAIQLQEINSNVSDTDVSEYHVSNTNVQNLSFLLWSCFNNMFFPYTDNDREDWEAERWYEPDIVKAGLEQGTIIWCYSQHCAVQFDFANDLSHVNVYYCGPVQFNVELARAAQQQAGVIQDFHNEPPWIQEFRDYAERVWYERSNDSISSGFESYSSETDYNNTGNPDTRYEDWRRRSPGSSSSGSDDVDLLAGLAQEQADRMQAALEEQEEEEEEGRRWQEEFERGLERLHLAEIDTDLAEIDRELVEWRGRQQNVETSVSDGESE